MKYIVGFGRFWFDFIVGDDWRLAVGVVTMLVVVHATARSHPGLWWLLPAAVALLLSLSIGLAVRKSIAGARTRSS